jgi:hypothetical protein
MMFKPKPRFDQLDQYLVRREYGLALEAITDEIKRRPESFNLLLRQAEILGLAGDREQAISVYRQLAQHYAREGFYARAIAVTNKILRLDPARKEVTDELAGLITAQQEVEKVSRERLERAAVPAGGADKTAPARSAWHAPPPAAEPAEEDVVVVVVDEDETPGPPVETRAAAGEPTAARAESVSPEQAAKERDAGQFFAAFPRPALDQLLSSTSVLSFAPGETIMREGEPGTAMFLIADGAVDVHTHDTAGKPLQLATLGPGEFFGEVAMLTGRPRTATIVASDRATVVEISREDLDSIMTRWPEVRQVLQKFYQERVQSTAEAMLARLRGGGA